MNQKMTAIYAGGVLYSGGSPVINDLKASGFTTVVVWTMHVAKDSGNLSFTYDHPLTENGQYIDQSNWASKIASLKTGTTAINRILFSVGAASSEDFPNIKNLIFAKPGSYPDHPDIGSDSKLYQNFLALKKAIPAIDGFDFDDEVLYDQPTTVAFAQMLYNLGYQVTFCPYSSRTFWVNCLYALNTQTPNLVTGFNLQCYSGGYTNDPADWITAIQSKMGSSFDAKGFVFPGLWCRHGSSCTDGQCPTGDDSIENQFNQWELANGIQGGFIWIYNSIAPCECSGTCSGAMTTAAYASAVSNGLSSSRKLGTR